MTKDEALRLALEALEFDSFYSTGKQEAITAIKAALEAKDEPLATLEDLEQEIYENTRQFVSFDVMEWMLKRYYTTPPQRKPLTVEEIAELDCYDHFKFARAIEAAHGIKGEA